MKVSLCEFFVYCSTKTITVILFFLSYLESVRTLMVPWLQRICEHASKVEDKTLPLLAQHWARISRTIQSKLQASVKLLIRCNYILLLSFAAHLRDGEKDWFVEYFYSLASLGSAHQTIKDKTNVIRSFRFVLCVFNLIPKAIGFCVDAGCCCAYGHGPEIGDLRRSASRLCRQ
jgi:hypothetical protein